ncbi:MAG TPA: sigma-70 family RNA polymerase sigma factor [Chloroflexota bacterium]
MDYARALDEELIGLVALRDERALERLYEKYGRAIYSLVLRMLRDPGRAEEVAQEVFLRVWRRPTSYVAGRGPFATWLLSVAHHRAVDELRARRHDPLPIDPLDGAGVDVPDEGEDLDELAWVRERRGTIRHALSALPDAQRAAIELAYFGGLTQREIADRLGQPLGTIKTRMRLAMQKLRGSLTDLAAVDGRANGRDGAVDPQRPDPTAVPGEVRRAEL